MKKVAMSIIFQLSCDIFRMYNYFEHRIILDGEKRTHGKHSAFAKANNGQRTELVCYFDKVIAGYVQEAE